MKNKVKVLSLGAGVQSSALYVAYLKGLLEDPPKFAVFADTQMEPKSVYEWLQKLKAIGQDKIPIHVVTKGNLGENPAKIPFFLKHPDGKKGMGWRQCTNDYKIQMVNKAVREQLKYPPRVRIKETVEMVIGISTDEKKRMTEPKEKWKKHFYPLIETLQWSRQDCVEFIKETGLGPPPRSACTICPYRSNKEWVALKKSDPEDFSKACDYDDWLREGAKSFSKYNADQYVHPSLLPLREVEFYDDSDQFSFEFGQVRNGMDSSCEGLCGL